MNEGLGQHRRRRWAALAGKRDFRLLWIGSATSELGSTITGVALPLLALHLTGSALAAGLLGTASSLTAWLAALPGGYLADRYGSRGVMVTADAVRATVLLVFTIGAVAGVMPTWAMVVGVVIAYAAAMAYQPASSKALKQVTGESLGEAIAVNQARSYTASIIGPPIGGILLAVCRPLPFAVDTLTFLVSLGCALGIRTRLYPGATSVTTGRLFPVMGKGWSVLWHDRLLRDLTFYSTAMNFAVSTVLSILVLGIGQQSHGSIAVGVGLSLSAAAGILGSLLAPAVLRWARLRSLLFTIALGRAVLVCAAAAIGNAIAVILAMASIMLITPILRATAARIQLERVPEDVLGRSVGAISLLGGALQPVAPMTAGALTTWITAAHALLIPGLLCLIPAGLAWRSRALEQKPSNPTADTTTPNSPVLP
ncbi:MFS transporter [Nocardia sp. NPDC088792]|uniref:MFS transporter n=1 Tax=Nocardia sp. NPDC088792 TaxID=3364332 RepID=UPI0038245002